MTPHFSVLWVNRHTQARDMVLPMLKDELRLMRALRAKAWAKGKTALVAASGRAVRFAAIA